MDSTRRRAGRKTAGSDGPGVKRRRLSSSLTRCEFPALQVPFAVLAEYSAAREDDVRPNVGVEQVAGQSGQLAILLWRLLGSGHEGQRAAISPDDDPSVGCGNARTGFAEAATFPQLPARSQVQAPQLLIREID